MEQCPFNPLVKEHLADPWSRMTEARRTSPVTEVFPGMVYVACHETAAGVFRDHETFSSDWLPMNPFAAEGDDPEQAQPFGMMDPPRHDTFRRLAVEGLHVRAVRAARPWLEETCDQFVEQFADRGHAEFVTQLASPFPIAAITHMLGLGVDRRPDLERWLAAIAAQADVASGLSGAEPNEGAEAEVREVHRFLETEILARRTGAREGDDILTRMVKYEDPDGRQFTDLEIRSQVMFLLTAGHETTRALISNAMFALATEPGLFDELRADPDLAPGIVTETLRYYSPVQMIFRMAKRDAELDGQRIAAGTLVCIGIASANRDEEDTAGSSRFDPRRESANRHLGLGLGIHYCVAASLSQMEAEIAIRTVGRRFATFRASPDLTYDPLVEPQISRAPKRVEVEFTSAQRTQDVPA